MGRAQINVTVPVLVLFMLVFSVGHDMYLMSVGRMVKGGLKGRSRQALVDAIASQKQGRKGKPAGNAVRAGAAPAAVSAIGLDLSAEVKMVAKRRDTHARAAVLLRHAENKLAEKTEFHRFLASASSSAAELHELARDENLASFAVSRKAGINMHEII
jgi:hypothetical protein